MHATATTIAATPAGFMREAMGVGLGARTVCAGEDGGICVGGGKEGEGVCGLDVIVGLGVDGGVDVG